MKVRIYQLGENNAEVVGALVLHDGQVVASPADSRLLRAILEEPIRVLIDDQDRELTAAADPGLFLDQLHRYYRGSRLWAGKAED